MSIAAVSDAGIRCGKRSQGDVATSNATQDLRAQVLGPKNRAAPPVVNRMDSGRMPTTASPLALLLVGKRFVAQLKAPSSSIALKRFIEGDPMNDATKRFAGWR